MREGFAVGSYFHTANYTDSKREQKGFEITVIVDVDPIRFCNSCLDLPYDETTPLTRGYKSVEQELIPYYYQMYMYC